MTFSKKAGGFGKSATVTQNVFETQAELDKKYDMCYVDADTILHQAAISLQQSYVIVTHTKSGWNERFPNKSTFWGLGKKIGGKLKEINDTKEKRGQELATKEDFTIEEFAEIKPEFADHLKAIDSGLSSIGQSVGGIKRNTNSKDYKLIISGGQGNYRNGYGKTLKYKGNRGEKPILYLELKEAMIDQYKSKIMLADFCEAEDLCGWFAKQEEARVGDNFDDWKICISYIDKDVDMVYSPSTNYSKWEKGETLPTKLECAFHLVTQVICGDTSCDNIQGLPKLAEEVTTKFGLRKSNGCGKASAENYLQGCTTEKEMWERAVFAYQSFYGMEAKEFEAWDGEKLTWSWLDYMHETAILVKMQEFEGQLYDVEDVLKEQGVDYTNKMYEVLPPQFVEEDKLREEVDSLKVLLLSLQKQLKPLKSEKKDLQIERLESGVVKVDEVIKQLDNLFLKE